MQIRWQMLAVATIARTAMGFQYQSVAPVAPLLGPELGLDQAGIGWLIGLYMLPGVVLALPGGMLGTRFGDKRVAVAALCAMVAGAGLLTAPWPLAWICLIGLIWGLPASVLVSLPGQLLSAESRGTGMGVFYTFYYFGMALLPAAAGLASDITGDTAAALWVGVLAAAATPAALVWLRRAQRESAAQ